MAAFLRLYLENLQESESTMHFIGRVTMLFANNSFNGMSDHHEIFTHFFLHPDVIL